VEVRGREEAAAAVKMKQRTILSDHPHGIYTK
jgi:hypothetical protein